MDDIKVIIQRMIDAGEPEDAIAGVVKAYAQNAGAKPIATDEPSTYAGGFYKGAKEGAVAGLRGFVKGVVPGAVNTVINAPKALVGTGLAALKGGVNLLSDPESTIRDAYTSVKGIPAAMAKTGDDMLTAGARDPEGLGRQIGEMTGGTMTGIAASAAVPLLPKPLMRGVGDTMEQMGVKGSWPIKMVGAHQIASGNPMGVLTMMAPAQLAKGGRALRIAGTEAGAAAGSLEGQYLKLHQDIQTGNMATVESRLAALQDDLVKRHAEARLPEQLAEVKKQQLQLDKLRGAAEKRVLAAQKPTPAQQEAIRLDKQKQKDVLDVTDAVEKMHSAEAKRIREANKAAADEAKRVAEVAKAKEGLTPSEPVITETVRGTTPEGAVHTKTTRYTAEDGAETAAQGPKGPKGGAPDSPSPEFPGLTNLEVSLLRKDRMPDAVIAKAAQTPRVQPASTLEQAGVATAPEMTPVAADAPGASANVRSPLYEDFHNAQLEQEMAQRDALRGTPADVAHSPIAQQVEAARVAAAPSALESSMMQSPELPSLPPSRSRTNAAKGGLTGNDVTALKKFVLENPDADPEMIAAHLADQRAARSAAYRTNAGLDKGAKLALELDDK